MFCLARQKVKNNPKRLLGMLGPSEVIVKERIFSQKKKIEKQLQRSLLAIELTVKL